MNDDNDVEVGVAVEDDKEEKKTKEEESNEEENEESPKKKKRRASGKAATKGTKKAAAAAAVGGPKIKRAISAFMFFSASRRPELKREHEEYTFGELGKKVGELWRGMRDNEKKPYVDLAAKDKKRYLAEVQKREMTSD